jgi:hypothetical protein
MERTLEPRSVARRGRRMEPWRKIYFLAPVVRTLDN